MLFDDCCCDAMVRERTEETLPIGKKKNRCFSAGRGGLFVHALSQQRNFCFPAVSRGRVSAFFACGAFPWRNIISRLRVVDYEYSMYDESAFLFLCGPDAHLTAPAPACALPHRGSACGCACFFFFAPSSLCCGRAPPPQ